MRVILLVMLLLLTACVRGKTNENQQPTYSPGGAILGVPVINKDAATVIVEGKVLMNGPLELVPKELDLALWKGTQLMQTVRVNRDGTFRFRGDIPKGKYEIKARGEKHVGHLKVEVDGIETRGLVVFLQRFR